MGGLRFECERKFSVIRSTVQGVPRCGTEGSEQLNEKGFLDFVRELNYTEWISGPTRILSEYRAAMDFPKVTNEQTKLAKLL